VILAKINNNDSTLSEITLRLKIDSCNNRVKDNQHDARGDLPKDFIKSSKKLHTKQRACYI